MLILMFSCDRPTCESLNPIFDSYEPDDREYKEELALQLQKLQGKELSYWFDKYESRNKKDYILVYIQGEEVMCQRINSR